MLNLYSRLAGMLNSLNHGTRATCYASLVQTCRMQAAKRISSEVVPKTWTAMYSTGHRNMYWLVTWPTLSLTDGGGVHALSHHQAPFDVGQRNDAVPKALKRY